MKVTYGRQDTQYRCLLRRYGNEPHAELAIAAAEQMKITELRIRKLYRERSQPAPASWDGPIAAVTRRAGLLKAQLGASPFCRTLQSLLPYSV